MIKSEKIEGDKIQALEEGKLRRSVEGRNGEVELVNKAQSFLDRVNDLVQVLLRIIRSRMCCCRVICLWCYNPIASTPTSSCCILQRIHLQKNYTLLELAPDNLRLSLSLFLSVSKSNKKRIEFKLVSSFLILCSNRPCQHESTATQ